MCSADQNAILGCWKNQVNPRFSCSIRKSLTAGTLELRGRIQCDCYEVSSVDGTCSPVVLKGKGAKKDNNKINNLD